MDARFQTPIHMGPWPWSFSKVRPFSFGRNIGHKIKSFRRREEFQSCERERESSPLNAPSSSSSNFFLSSLTTHFVTHGDCASTFISFRRFSRGRGIVRPFLLGSICGRRCRNFPRFLRPSKPWASSPTSKKDERDLGFSNSGYSILYIQLLENAAPVK